MRKAFCWNFLLRIVLAWDVTSHVHLPQTYFTSTNYSFTVVDGISLWDLTADFCQTISYEECIDFTYTLSYYYYGNIYFPRHPKSSIEDYYYQRKDLITYATKRFEYKSYLEIGCDQNQTFGKIEHLFNQAICVDPSKGGTIRMTSDDFFAQNIEKFDIVFIDGLHEAHQVGTLINIDYSPRCGEIL